MSGVINLLRHYVTPPHDRIVNKTNSPAALNVTTGELICFGFSYFWFNIFDTSTGRYTIE